MLLRWIPMLGHSSPTTIALVHELLRRRGAAILYLVLLLSGAALAGLKFILLKDLVQAGLASQTDQVPLLLLGTVACWLVSHLGMYAASLVGIRLERQVGVDLVQRTLDHWVDRSSAHLRRMDANQAVHYLRTSLVTVGRTLRAMLTAINQVFVALFAIGTAFWIQPVLAVFCLVMAMLMLWWTARHIGLQRLGVSTAFEGQRQIQSRLCRLFAALPQIKLFGAGDDQLARLAEPIQRQRTGEHLALLAQRRATLEINLFAAVAGLILVGVGGLLMHWNLGGIADLTTLLVLNQSIFQSLRHVFTQWASAEENSDYLALLVEKPGPVEAKHARGTQLVKRIETIECRDASFAIGETVLLREVTCNLQRGHLYGVAGPSGSGKTMLLHLLGGHSAPSTGILRVNGVPSSELDHDELGRRISLTTWPPVVLKGTLADNLRVARRDSSDAELMAVLHQVGFEPDLRQLHQVGGLHAGLGPKGVKLSVGQLQRLALARALLRAPEVLLVDDLLTGLDPESTGTVLASLTAFAKEHIVVLVAPTLTAIAACAEVFLTCEGRFVAQTTPEHAMSDTALSPILFPKSARAA